MARRVKKPQRKAKSKPVPMGVSGRLPDPGLRIATALERLAPPALAAPDFAAADAFVWQPPAGRPAPVTRVDRVKVALLKGIAPERGLLLGNTRRLARRLPGTKPLLWGAPGTSKASL